MHWFSKIFRSSSTVDTTAELVFKSGENAFGYACKYMDCSLGEGRTVPAIVVDAREVASDEISPVKTEPDQSQVAMIRVASHEGGFVIPAKTAGAQSSRRPDLVSQEGHDNRHPDLKPGDLVSFTAMTYNKEIAETVGNKESGWVGLITSKLEPKLDTRAAPSIWQIEEKFHD